MTDSQLSEADMAAMTPDAIAEAHDQGRFDAILGAVPADVELLERARGTAPLTTADVAALSRLGHHDLIVSAHDAGRITNGDHQS